MNDKIRPPTHTIIPPEHHASRGIGKAYPKYERKRIMFLHGNFPVELQSQSVRVAQGAHAHAADITDWRWLRFRNLTSGVRPFRRTGNRRAVREVSSQALVDLALY